MPRTAHSDHHSATLLASGHIVPSSASSFVPPHHHKNAYHSIPSPIKKKAAVVGGGGGGSASASALEYVSKSFIVTSGPPPSHQQQHNHQQHYSRHEYAGDEGAAFLHHPASTNSNGVVGVGRTHAAVPPTLLPPRPQTAVRHPLPPHLSYLDDDEDDAAAEASGDDGGAAGGGAGASGGSGIDCGSCTLLQFESCVSTLATYQQHQHQPEGGGVGEGDRNGSGGAAHTTTISPAAIAPPPPLSPSSHNPTASASADAAIKRLRQSFVDGTLSEDSNTYMSFSSVEGINRLEEEYLATRRRAIARIMLRSVPDDRHRVALIAARMAVRMLVSYDAFALKGFAPFICRDAGEWEGVVRARVVSGELPSDQVELLLTRDVGERLALFTSRSGTRSFIQVLFDAFAHSVKFFTEPLTFFASLCYLDRLHAYYYATHVNGLSTADSAPPMRVYKDHYLRLFMTLMIISCKVHADLKSTIGYFMRHVPGMGRCGVTVKELVRYECDVLNVLGFNGTVDKTHVSALLASFAAPDEKQVAEQLLFY